MAVNSANAYAPSFLQSNDKKTSPHRSNTLKSTPEVHEPAVECTELVYHSHCSCKPYKSSPTAARVTTHGAAPLWARQQVYHLVGKSQELRYHQFVQEGSQHHVSSTPRLEPVTEPVAADDRSRHIKKQSCAYLNMVYSVSLRAK